MCVSPNTIYGMYTVTAGVKILAFVKSYYTSTPFEPHSSRVDIVVKNYTNKKLTARSKLSQLCMS